MQTSQTPTNRKIPHDPPSHEVPPPKLEYIQPLNSWLKERKVKVIFGTSYEATLYTFDILEGPFGKYPKNPG